MAGPSACLLPVRCSGTSGSPAEHWAGSGGLAGGTLPAAAWASAGHGSPRVRRERLEVMWKGTVTEKGPEMWTPAHFSARLRLALGERPGATSEARPALGVVGSDLVLFSPSDSGPRGSSCPFSFSSRLSSNSGQLSGAGSEGQVSKLSRRCGGCFADLFLLSRESSVPSGGKSQGLEVYPVPRPPHT